MSDPVQEAREALAIELARAEELSAGGSGSTDLVHSRSTDPVAAKRQIAQAQAKLRKQEEVVRRAAERVEQAMEREMERVARILAPMEKAVKRLQDGLFSVNLYLGRDEDILLLRDGESAPAETPIGLRQMLLFMDEEMAAASPEGGILPTEVELFDEWLLADDAHLDQVLPETKGIVALRPRRHDPRGGYRDRDEVAANRFTYWLVRNGERVYRTVTALELEDRVLPYADEMVRLFMREERGGKMSPLRPGSHEWERAQQEAETTERTYMRIGLVLEGLLHRTPIFHPLPEAGVSFLDPRDVEAGRVRYITDAEGLLGTGAESFEAWRKRLAGDLLPGMRIVLGPGLEQYNAREYGRGNERLTPSIANMPEVGAIYTVESRSTARDRRRGRDATALIFRYHEGERWIGDGAWGGGELREPKKRASCRVFTSDEFVLPFDGAEVAEMRRFLNSRTDRHHYAEMFPILKRAIAAKEREAEVERPFREMLVGVLARENGVSVEKARADVHGLVSWWKTKNKVHRPLLLEAQRAEREDGGRKGSSELGMRGREAQREALREGAAARSRRRERQETVEQFERSKLAVSMIVAEHARRLADERRPVDERVIAKLHALHPTERLAIVRPRGRGYLVVVAAEPLKNVYVHEYEYSARGELKESREWVLPRLASVKQWLAIEAEERWAKWDFAADEHAHLRGPERDRLRELACEWLDELADGLVVAVDRAGSKVGLWRYDKRPKIDERRPLTNTPRQPEIEEWTGKWRRDADGKIVLKRQMQTTHRVGGRYDGREGPWDKREYSSRDPWGNDAAGRPRIWTVVKRDEKMLRMVERDVKAYEKVEARRVELHERASVLTNSIEAEWLRRAWARERERFDEDFGDPALWLAHRKSKERHIQFPSDWRLREYAGSMSRRLMLWEAVARFVEAGEDPEGRTVADVLAEATERWGAEEAKADSWHRVEHDGPVKRFTAPEELHDFVLTTLVFKHDAPEPEPDEDGEVDDLGLADAVLADVRASLDDDDDEDVEFDFEGDAIEDEAQLDA